MQETQVRFLAWKDSPEKGKATHFNILAWRIPWTEDPGELQSRRLLLLLLGCHFFLQCMKVKEKVKSLSRV